VDEDILGKMDSWKGVSWLETKWCWSYREGSETSN